MNEETPILSEEQIKEAEQLSLEDLWMTLIKSTVDVAKAWFPDVVQDLQSIK